MHVDEAGGDHQPFRIDGPLRQPLQVATHCHDPVAADGHVAVKPRIAAAVHDPPVADQQVPRLLPTHAVEHRHCRRHPAAAPVVLARSAVEPVVGNAQLFQPLMGLLHLGAEIAVAEQRQPHRRADAAPLAGPEQRGLLLEQPRDLVLGEVLLVAEGAAHAELVRPVFHQGRIPRRGRGELIRMSQDQAERSPARLAEAQQQPDRFRGGIHPIDQGQDGAQQVRLIGPMRIARMIGKPRQLGERWGYDNQAVLLVQPQLPHFVQAVSEVILLVRLHRQHEEEAPSILFGELPGGQDSDQHRLALPRRCQAIAEDTVRVLLRRGNLGLGERFLLGPARRHKREGEQQDSQTEQRTHEVLPWECRAGWWSQQIARGHVSTIAAGW